MRNFVNTPLRIKNRRSRSIAVAALNPLVSLFKDQLESECGTLSKKYGLDKRGDFLMYWYFMRLHEFNDAGVGEIACDGGGDLGIDAVWIDDDVLIHFYAFKNPEDALKAFPAGEVDKTIAGLQVILKKEHESIANPELRARLEDVYQQVPKGYRIHFITSGQGLTPESKVKLDAMIAALSGPSSSMVGWDESSVVELQEQFYQQMLPSVKDPLKFKLEQQPYMLRSGAADCYMFHVDGKILADLYEQHGEALLQRNIRVDQRDTATNRSIEATCVGDDSKNFLHFNNGVTFLCATAAYDNFQHYLNLEKAQVVNGGQTIRALHRASQKGFLKANVLVAARAITSSGDKDFPSDVAVNQNNQNQMRAGFLRSNDPRVVQLDHALAARGWYLERREGELKAAVASNELAAIEARIGRSVDGRTIHLKEGAQAYTATFYQQPEIAKKNPAKIFLSVEDGGHYEKIFSTDMTAERVIIAHTINAFVDDFVRSFAKVRKKLQASDDIGDIKASYEPVLGHLLANRYSEGINQVMPQCQLFLCGTIFKDLTEFQGNPPLSLPGLLNARGTELIREHLCMILDFASNNKDKADKSWPTLLKSMSFFSNVTAYIQGIRQNGSGKGSAIGSATAVGVATASGG